MVEIDVSDMEIQNGKFEYYKIRLCTSGRSQSKKCHHDGNSTGKVSWIILTMGLCDQGYKLQFPKKRYRSPSSTKKLPSPICNQYSTKK